MEISGRLTFLVPVLIMTYYSVIGGWISKYLFVYLVSDGTEAAADGYFTSFITSDIAPIVFMLIFLALTAWIVFRGVEKGIEKFSKIIMPGLILFNRDHFHFLSDTVSHSGRWYCSYRYARSVCLFKTGLSRINRKTFSGNSSGCDESVILFLKRIYGNYDHLRFLC